MGDEKVVAFRQRPRSHASIECETPPESDMSEDSEWEDTKGAQPADDQRLQSKAQFTKLMDA